MVISLLRITINQGLHSLLSRGKIIISLLKLLFIISFFNINLYSLVFAESQQIIDYNYDGAGNIISVRSGQNLGPPDVTNFSPPFVNKESFAFVTATGVNLFKANVSINTLGVTLISVTSISDMEIQFTVFADNTAVTGTVPVTFTTRLGTDIENIIVADRTPVVSTDPNPIILTPNGQGVDVLLAFDQPFATDQIFDVAITDESIASISAQTITLLAGETEVSTTVTGLIVGSTTLEINQLSNFLALGIPVVVNEAQLPAGSHLFSSKPLGISVYTGPVVFSGSGVSSTPYPLGVSIYTGPVSFSGSGTSSTPYPLGIALGTTINQTTPTSIQRGTSATLTIDGFELDAVTAISFNIPNDITQTSAFTVTPDGTQMTIPIAITSAAQTGLRFIVFTTVSGNVLVPEGAFQITN